MCSLGRTRMFLGEHSVFLGEHRGLERDCHPQIGQSVLGGITLTPTFRLLDLDVASVLENLDSSSDSLTPKRSEQILLGQVGLRAEEL